MQRSITISFPLQYVFLYECFERIQEEQQWRHKLRSDAAAVATASAVSPEESNDDATTTTTSNEEEKQ